MLVFPCETGELRNCVPKEQICYAIYTVLSNFACSYTHLKSASPFEAELQQNVRKLTIPVMDKK